MTPEIRQAATLQTPAGRLVLPATLQTSFDF